MFDVHTTTIWMHLTPLIISCLFIGFAVSHFFMRVANYTNS